MKNNRSFLKELLLINMIRGLVTKFRFFYRAVVRRKLRTLDLESKEISPMTLEHNLKQVRGSAVPRSNKLLRPLSIIEAVDPILNPDARVLSIGPRDEGELFSLVGLGYRAKNIVGLDLISYSPWVKLGDMHNMEFQDNSFDVVICGWTLSYSSDRPKAAQEIVRVVKNGGIVAVGVVAPRPREEIIAERGYIPGDETRIPDSAGMLDLFGESIDYVYFRHDPPSSRAGKPGTISAIFSVKK